MKPPKFISVALEIKSSSPLDSLAAEFGKTVGINYCGKAFGGYLLSVETHRSHKTPEKNIQSLCSLIEKLSPAAKKTWRRAKLRIFDIGCEARHSKDTGSHLIIDTKVLRQVTNLSATIAMSFYREDNKST